MLCVSCRKYRSPYLRNRKPLFVIASFAQNVRLHLFQMLALPPIFWSYKGWAFWERHPDGAHCIRRTELWALSGRELFQTLERDITGLHRNIPRRRVPRPYGRRRARTTIILIRTETVSSYFCAYLAAAVMLHSYFSRTRAHRRFPDCTRAFMSTCQIFYANTNFASFIQKNLAR